MKIVFLDHATVGDDVSTDVFEEFGEVVTYELSSPDEIVSRIADADVVLINKVRLTAEILAGAKNLKLICLAATGFDNVDVAYCRMRGIGVCNVAGYSTQCVSQLTVSMALSLMTHLEEYHGYVSSGEYTNSGKFNKLTPVFHEIAGKTWGIVGYGNIGKAVGRVAEALGCRILIHKKTPVAGLTCVDLETICRESDILSIHVPLNDSTRGMIDREHVAMMKKNAIVVNVARGAVTDEGALAQAILDGRIAGLGVDVYSKEPFPAEHPFTSIRQLPNVILTPHMAWGGYETRVRLMTEMAENIRSFTEGGRRSRVD